MGFPMEQIYEIYNQTRDFLRSVEFLAFFGIFVGLALIIYLNNIWKVLQEIDLRLMEIRDHVSDFDLPSKGENQEFKSDREADRYMEKHSEK